MAHSTAAIEQTYGEAAEQSEFKKKTYDIELKFHPKDDKSLCLNLCSSQGQCVYDTGFSELPFCECFDGFTGSDCSLANKVISMNTYKQVNLFEGNSALWTLKSETGNIFLEMARVDGSFWVYTKIINGKTHKRVQNLLGATGASDSHALVPSPVNYDSKYFFSSLEQGTHSVGETIKISIQDPASYNQEKDDYTLHILLVSKAANSTVTENDLEPGKRVSSGVFKIVSQVEVEESNGVTAILVLVITFVSLTLILFILFMAYQTYQRRKLQGEVTAQPAESKPVVTNLPTSMSGPDHTIINLLSNNNQQDG